jgi:hypothetical protein
MRVMLALALALGLPFPQAASAPPQTAAAQPAATSSKIWIGRYAEIEDFLRTVDIDRLSNPKEGTTGGTRHAYFKAGSLFPEGALRNLGPGRYGGFFESYRSEVAAYKMDRLLQLDMVPPTVLRDYKGQMVSLQLWVPNIRLLKEINEKKITIPTTLALIRQFSRQKVFDDLVGNLDENATNLAFDPVWNVIKVDHSRCFTSMGTMPFEVGAAKGVLRIDREFLDRVGALDKPTLQREIGAYVEAGAIDAMLLRRDAIVKGFDRLIQQKGAAQVILP